MVINNAISAGEFVYCASYWSPNETNFYHNEGDGHYHQWAYVLDGFGFGEIWQTKDGPVLLKEHNKQSGQLIDLTPTKGLYHLTYTREHSLSMVLFNPIPSTRNLKVEILRGPQSRTLTTTDNRLTVVCLTGPVTINDKQVESLQHSKIFPNKQATIVLTNGSVCALVSQAE